MLKRSAFALFTAKQALIRNCVSVAFQGLAPLFITQPGVPRINFSLKDFNFCLFNDFILSSVPKIFRDKFELENI
jgi:hypothetical protein